VSIQDINCVLIPFCEARFKVKLKPPMYRVFSLKNILTYGPIIGGQARGLTVFLIVFLLEINQFHPIQKKISFTIQDCFTVEISNSSLLIFPLMMALSFLIGAFIYALHRALILPIFYKSFMYCQFKSQKPKEGNKTQDSFCIRDIFIPWKEPEPIVDRNLSRWKLQQNKYSIINNLTEWAAQIHFLYCVTWAIVLAIIIAYIVSSKINNKLEFNNALCFYLLLPIAILTFSITLSSNKRYLDHETKIIKEDELERQQLETSI